MNREILFKAKRLDTGDGPDLNANYVLLSRGKRHDYFTSCLPWPQKGPAINLPLGTQAPVKIVSGSAGGQAYVALSRVKTSEGLYLLNWNQRLVKADPEAVKFYLESMEGK